MNNDRKISSLFSKTPLAIAEQSTSTLEDFSARTDLLREELSVFPFLVDSLSQIGASFEKSVISLSEQLQTKLKDTIIDERLSQFFQLTVNALLTFGVETRQKLFQFGQFKEELDSDLEELNSAFEYIKESIIAQKEELEETVIKKNNTFIGQSELYAVHRNLLYMDKEHPVADRMSVFQKNKERYDTKICEIVNQEFRRINFELFSLVEKEKRVKKKTQVFLTDLIKMLLGKVDKVDEQISDLEGNLEPFKSHIENSKMKIDIHFGEFADGYEFRLVSSFDNSKQLNLILNNPFYEYLFKQVEALEKKVKIRELIFCETLLDSLYTKDKPIDESSYKKLQLFFSKENVLDYVAYNIMLKKGQWMMTKPFETTILPSNIFNNFKKIVDLLLIASLKNRKIHYESLYYLMRFSLAFLDPEYNLIFENSRNLLLKNEDFWVNLFLYFKEHMNPKQLENEDIVKTTISKEPRLNRLISIFKRNGAEKDNGIISPAFDSILFLTLKVGLDFKTIAKVLLKIVPKFNVPVPLVKSLVNKKLGPLLASVSTSDGFSGIGVFKNQKKTKELKNYRIYKTLKLSSVYLNPKEILKTTSLNRYINDRKLKITNNVLFSLCDINSEKRQFLYSLNIKEKFRKMEICKSFPKDQRSSLIHMDMIRTECEAVEDTESIEIILLNICSPSIFNFSYYQGLNFIARHLFTLYTKDSKLTLQTACSLLETHFTKFFDEEFNGLKKLFFSLKIIIKTRLPLLFNYLTNVRKIDVEIIFTAWCLTICTHLNIEDKKDEHVIEIVDIFVAKGWPGLFRVILIILEETSDLLFKSNFDEILMLFSTINKKGFRKVGNGKFKFRFKKRVGRIRGIGWRLVDALNNEYSHALRRVGRVLDKLGEEDKEENKVEEKNRTKEKEDK